MSEPPRWKGREVRWAPRDDREHRDFIDWTIERLAEEAVKNVKPSTNAMPHSLQLAIAVARHGNLRPLRAMYPHFAFLFQPPKQGRGKYPRKSNLDGFPLQKAREERPLIRKIWKEHFGRINRGPTVSPSMADVLGKRWKLTDEEKERLLKPSGKHKPRRRKSRAI